jgi:hypothetical protein
MWVRWLAWAAWLVPAAMSADGALSCRWQPGTTAIAYGASDGKEALATDVRALVQGAQLIDAGGATPKFDALTPARPARLTEPLVCHGDEREPADGMVELTFSRKVRLGIEYTLGKCQLFYRCPGSASADGPAPPQLYLGFVGGGAPVSRALPSPPAD